MRRVLIPVFLLVTLCAAVAQAPGFSPFSADMSMKLKDGKDMNGKVYFSGTKMRQEMNTSGHQMIQIMDMQKKVADTLMPEQKMYMEMDLSKMQQQHRGPKMPDLKAYDPTNPCAQLEDMTCEKAGSETVNGRSAEKWIFKSKKDGSTITSWIDRKIHYPIRTVSKDMQMDLTNVQEGMPSASLFEIPPGYRKLDMGSMMRGQMPQAAGKDDE
jgi:outer membrane lipoprotein-sorting protein